MIHAANGVMVAATRQHVGKTTSCLAIVSKLIDLCGDVGFIKPVGQRHVDMDGQRVDKDVKLFKEYFGLEKCDAADMSPVVIPRGYTRRYLDGEITEVGQIEAIQEAFGRIASANNFVVAEGTGRKFCCIHIHIFNTSA
jgi:phosphate acetyltransferase